MKYFLKTDKGLDSDFLLLDQEEQYMEIEQSKLSAAVPMKI